MIRINSRSGSRWRICLTLRRNRTEVVTRTRVRPMARRCAIGSGPNAENSGEYTHCARSVPSAATYSSGTRPASVATPDPGSIPWRRSPPAKRFIRCSSIAYVISTGRSVSTSSRENHRSAVCSARPARTCRDTARSAMLRSVAPGASPSSRRAVSHRSAVDAPAGPDRSSSVAMFRSFRRLHLRLSGLVAAEARGQGPRDQVLITAGGAASSRTCGNAICVDSTPASAAICPAVDTSASSRLITPTTRSWSTTGTLLIACRAKTA